MAAIASSKPAPLSKRAVALAGAALALWSAAAVLYCYLHGWILYYGDAEAHLNIARRIVDSRTPGFGQIGTVWLPLPHLMMMPLARVDWLWRTGLAGALPSAAAFVAAGVFLFAAVRRVFDSAAAGAAATALLALNPNLLYLQSTPMTEPLFLAAFMALLYFAVLYSQTQSWLALGAAGLAATAGTLIRYEGWFLIPFVTLFVLETSNSRRVARAALFGAIASIGPLCWLAYNWWFCGDALAFYRGPASAAAIQGSAPYPGKGDWKLAWVQLRTAAWLCAGTTLVWMALAGGVAALLRRAIWPLVLLALPAVFYVWAIHSAGNPVFVPALWPHSYYNTRYGLELFPLAVFAASALVTLAPRRAQAMAAAVVVAAALVPWLAHPSADHWITWKESQVNSEARRAWTKAAADFLGPRYRGGEGVFTSFGDLTGIFRSAGIPLREALTADSWPQGPAALGRPDLFLTETWAVAQAGDAVQKSVGRVGVHYELVRTIMVKGAPALEIYRRDRSKLWQPLLNPAPSPITWSRPPSRSTAIASSATSASSGASRCAPAPCSAP